MTGHTKPTPLLSARRLAALEHQAFHNGLTASAAAAMRKQGVDPDQKPHGMLITVTPREMQAFLAAYKADA